ncbi:MAG: hypothetical protein WBD31_30045, partial [Rubripirellula sp.]
FAVQLIAHKVLRWVCPVFLIVMLTTSAFLAAAEIISGSSGWTYTTLLGLQLCGYGIASLHVFKSFRRFRLVYVAYYFLMVNVASARGLAMLAAGHAIGVWKPER